MHALHNFAQGKNIASTDDIGFIAHLVATMVMRTSTSDWEGKIDPERVYATGETILNATQTRRENLTLTLAWSMSLSTQCQYAYTAGFSMGCMMAHRLALERSDIIAGRRGPAGQTLM